MRVAIAARVHKDTEAGLFTFFPGKVKYIPDIRGLRDEELDFTTSFRL